MCIRDRYIECRIAGQTEFGGLDSAGRGRAGSENWVRPSAVIPAQAGIQVCPSDQEVFCGRTPIATDLLLLESPVANLTGVPGAHMSQESLVEIRDLNFSYDNLSLIHI